jgi:hypothetical protein
MPTSDASYRIVIQGVLAAAVAETGCGGCVLEK